MNTTPPAVAIAAVAAPDMIINPTTTTDYLRRPPTFRVPPLKTLAQLDSSRVGIIKSFLSPELGFRLNKHTNKHIS